MLVAQVMGKRLALLSSRMRSLSSGTSTGAHDADMDGEVGEICRILLLNDQSELDKDAALSSLNIRPRRLTHRLVAHVLESVEHVDVALPFLKWAAQRKHGTGPNLWSAMISSLARLDKLQEASVWEFIQKELLGANPDMEAYISLVFKAGCRDRAVRVYQRMLLDKGLPPSVAICKTLARRLASESDVVEAQDANVLVKCLDTRMLNTIIKDCARAGRIQTVRRILLSMRDKLKANAYSYKLVIAGCCKFGQVDAACQLYELMMLDDNVKLDLDKSKDNKKKKKKAAAIAAAGAFNSLVSELCRVGRRKEACRLFKSSSNEMRAGADVVTYTSVIHALCKQGDCNGALELLGTMAAPNVVTYSSLIDGLCKAGKLEDAVRVFQQMQATGPAPNVFTYNSLIYGLCRFNKLEEAFTLLRSMKDRGCHPSIANKNTLVSGICKQIIEDYQRREYGGKYGNKLFCEHMAEMRAIEEDRLALLYSCLEYMFGTGDPDSCDHHSSPNRCTYTIVIHFLCKVDKLAEAAKIWGVMKRKIRQAEIDAVAYNSFLYGLVKKNKLDEAASLFNEIGQPTLITHSLLLHGYFKAGDLTSASHVYEAMVKRGLCPDLTLYNIMLNGLSKAKLHTQVAQLSADMLNNGVAPCVVTYSILIHGFCRDGQLQPAQQIIHMMKERGCTPDVVTYNTLLDCLCKNHLLEDALNLFREMKHYCRYSAATWNIIIDGILEMRELLAAETIFLQLITDGFFPKYITYETLLDRIIRTKEATTGPGAQDGQDVGLSFGYRRIVDFFLD